MDAAAKIVNAILNGKWTNEPPAWANISRMTSEDFPHSMNHQYTRAVQTAEVFIILFQINPKFDPRKFLTACGLKTEARMYKVIDRLK
jgi:hypothetical protein